MLLSKHLAISTESISRGLPCTELSKQKPKSQTCSDGDGRNKALTLAGFPVSNPFNHHNFFWIITTLVGFRQDLDVWEDITLQVLGNAAAC